MADFNYAELCLAMDHLYGLKDIHHIDSFDALLYQLGLREMMKSTSAADQDEALYTLIHLHLDDLHSGFNTIQAMNDPEALMDLSDRIGSGPSDRAFAGEYLRYLIARMVSREEGIPAYEEIGDTAYITFDHFAGVPQGVDYYETAACGTGFQISGFTRLAFLKNGSFYDIDQGAVPDFTISKYMSFYDRERLTEYIDGLM